MTFTRDATGLTFACIEERERADRELLASMMMRHGFATGHGDTLADLIAELDAQLTERKEQAWSDGIDAMGEDA